MAPNLEECVPDGGDPRRYVPPVVLFLSPLSNSSDEGYDTMNNNTRRSSSSTSNDDGMSEVDDDEDEDLFQLSRVCRVPLEHNLRELLVRVTSTEDLVTVTQVKLRVIARDLPLQQLGVHIPALRELILDGSVVSTLRDLGCGLRNLKVLRVNRCSLTCLDGMLAFEHLEELYAADNAIENVTGCAFLTNIRVIDLKRNPLKNIVRTLGFLTLCEHLEHIHLEGSSDEMRNRSSSDYRQIVKSLLPALKTLDGITFGENEGGGGDVEPSTPTKQLCEGVPTDNSRSNGVNLNGTAEYHGKIGIITGTQLGTCCCDDNSIRESCHRRQTYGFTSPRVRRRTVMPLDAATCGYSVRFPPKVCLDRPPSSASSMSSTSSSSNDSSRTEANKEDEKIHF